MSLSLWIQVIQIIALVALMVRYHLSYKSYCEALRENQTFYLEHRARIAAMVDSLTKFKGEIEQVRDRLKAGAYR